MQMYKIKSNSQQQRIKKLTSYLVMTVIGIVLIIPLLWMVFTSLKPMEEIVRYPPTFFPEEINFSNYLDTINAFPFWQYAKNTLFITVLVVFGNVLSNSFIAYGFAKLDFPGKKTDFFSGPFYNDDSRICDDDSTIRAVF